MRTLSHVAQVSSVCLYFHPWSSACALVLECSLHPSLYFFLKSFFHLFLNPAMVPDENSMEDPLCNSSFGSMVSLDYVTPDTKCLHVSKPGRPDLLWSVTKWCRACDKRLLRLTDYSNQSKEQRQFCLVENTLEELRRGLFQDGPFADDLQHLQVYSAFFASHTFVPIS